jgi:hypothetical protein
MQKNNSESILLNGEKEMATVAKIGILISSGGYLIFNLLNPS